MSIVLTGTKTVSNNVSPGITASALTTLLATAIENITVAQLYQLVDATRRLSCGDTSKTLGNLFV